MNIVEIQNLTFSFSKKVTPVIKDFAFSMEKGEIVGVLGSSGSGKSTLLRLIAGLEMPTSGNITIAGTTAVNERIFLERPQISQEKLFPAVSIIKLLNTVSNPELRWEIVIRSEASVFKNSICGSVGIVNGVSGIKGHEIAPSELAGGIQIDRGFEKDTCLFKCFIGLFLIDF